MRDRGKRVWRLGKGRGRPVSLRLHHSRPRRGHGGRHGGRRLRVCLRARKRGDWRRQRLRPPRGGGTSCGCAGRGAKAPLPLPLAASRLVKPFGAGVRRLEGRGERGRWPPKRRRRCGAGLAPLTKTAAGWARPPAAVLARAARRAARRAPYRYACTCVHLCERQTFFSTYVSFTSFAAFGRRGPPTGQAPRKVQNCICMYWRLF